MLLLERPTPSRATSPSCGAARPNPGIRCGLAIPAKNATPRRPVVPTVERPGARRSPIDPTRTPASQSAQPSCHHSGLCWFNGLVHVRGADLFRGLLSSILAWFASAEAPHRTHRSRNGVGQRGRGGDGAMSMKTVHPTSAVGQRCVVTPAALGLATTRRFRLEACSACRWRRGPCGDSRSSPDEKRPRPRRPRGRDRRP